MGNYNIIVYWLHCVMVINYTEMFDKTAKIIITVTYWLVTSSNGSMTNDYISLDYFDLR